MPGFFLACLLLLPLLALGVLRNALMSVESGELREMRDQLPGSGQQQ